MGKKIEFMLVVIILLLSSQVIQNSINLKYVQTSSRDVDSILVYLTRKEQDKTEFLSKLQKTIINLQEQILLKQKRK